SPVVSPVRAEQASPHPVGRDGRAVSRPGGPGPAPPSTPGVFTPRTGRTGPFRDVEGLGAASRFPALQSPVPAPGTPEGAQRSRPPGRPADRRGRRAPRRPRLAGLPVAVAVGVVVGTAAR